MKRNGQRPKIAIQKRYYEIAEAISNREILIRKNEDEKVTCLHSAVCDNDPDMLEYILNKKHVDFDSNHEVFGTPLALALTMGFHKCIEVLEKSKVDVNTENKYCQSPLHEAITSGMTDHCPYLIEHLKDIDRPGFMGLTGLQFAVIKGRKDLCYELMKNGADCLGYVEGLQQSDFNQAVVPISTRENAVTLCLKMHGTIYPCFLEVLDQINDKCSDGDENTLLHLAVQTLQPDLCRTLVNCEANVEAINKQGNSPIFELFKPVDDDIGDDNIDKIITISDMLIDSGVDINKKSGSGLTVFESASQCNSERLVRHLLLKQPDLQIVTEDDFKLAFTNKWFVYAEDLIHQFPEDLSKSLISTEIFHLAMPHADPKLLESLYIKATSMVQQSIIEDMLVHFATNNDRDAFLKLLETKIIEPKLLATGETLFTSLLKNKNEKYCWEIINNPANRVCFNLANAINKIPLQIAIETELYDLMCTLMYKCDQLNNEDVDGNTALMQLFQKLSVNTDVSVEEKLMTAARTIISRGGNIYKKTSKGIKPIELCLKLDLRTEIETFHRTERNKQKLICKICLESVLDLSFECGHAFCTPCSKEREICPICKQELTNPRKLYILQ